MIVVMATVEVKPDKAEDYERLFRALAPRIRQSNPGILFYEMMKSADAPTVYKAVEVYRDRAAMKAHVESQFLKDEMPPVLACMVGMPKIETFETVDY